MVNSTEKCLEILLEIASDLEALGISVRNRVAELVQPATVREESFLCLTWIAKKGSRLSDFDIATRDGNNQEKYQHALNILKQNCATINERFHEPQYQHTYWVFQDTIYRQEMKPEL